MTEHRRLRLRAGIKNWFWAIAIVLVVIAIASGWIAYETHVAPETATEERAVSSWSTHGSFDHEAVVQNENPIFPVNETLENRSMYYRTVSPVFTGAYTFSYDAPNGGSSTVESVVTLEIRSVNGEDEDQEIHWSISETLAEREVADVEPGSPVTLEFEQNATALRNRIANISDRLGGSPGTIETRIIATSVVDGRIDGESVSTSERYVLPITIDSNTYSFGETGQFTDTHEQTERVEVSKTYGPIRTYVAPASSAIAILGLVMLGWL